jgi:putative selenium metabolism protein SsnA
MLITNGKVVTWDQPNEILEGQALHIKNGHIVEIGGESELKVRFPNEETLDAGGQYIMPGNICAHTHFYGAFSRGMAIPGSAPKDFPEILGKLWWPLDKALTAEDVKYSALVCLVDAVKHGTTTLIDHHASPSAIEGSLDWIAEAVEQAGLRASLCYEVTDRNGVEGAKAGITENVRFIKKAAAQKNSRVSALFGLHASLTLSEETLRACREAIPEESGFHIHVAEHSVDEYDSIARTGSRVVDRLYRHGILGPKSIVVHAVHVDAREIQLLSETDTWVAHQPRSNMNNAVGMPMVESMLRAGIKVCLGNDGFSNSMWEEWKTAYLVHKLWNLDPRRMNGMDVVQMAVYNNTDLARTMFGGETIGVLRAGAAADIIFVDYKPFTPLTGGNLPWHMLFGFHESMITMTMVDGKVLMKDRKLLGLDEEAIAARARELVPAVWKRYEEQFA